MENKRKFSLFTKLCIIVGIAFIIYGFLCSKFNIYVFWESKWIGWELLLLALFDFLTTRISIRSKKKKKSIFEWIVLGHLLFLFLIQIVIFISVPQTNAYNAVKYFLDKDPKIVQELGQINGLSPLPYGTYSSEQSSEGIRGECYYLLIVKGSKKYKRINFIIHKEFNTEWIVKIDN